MELVVSKAITKHPDQCQQTAHELLNELTAVEAGINMHGRLQLPPPRSQLTARRAVLTPIAVVLLLAASLVTFFEQESLRRWFGLAKPVPIHLAILPFTSTGNDPGTKAFGDGLTETLAAKLTQLTGSYPLQVVPQAKFVPRV